MADPALALGGRPVGPRPIRLPRRWLVRLGPQAAAAGRAELAVALACVLALLAILAAETYWTNETIGALSVFPVSVAGWLLSRRALSAVVVIGVALRILALDLGTVGRFTAISQAVVLPLVAVACHLAASSRSSSAAAVDRDRQLRELAFLLGAGQKLASSLDPEVVLKGAVEVTAEGVSRPGGGRPALAAYHRLRGDLLCVEAVTDEPGSSLAGFEYPLARNQGALGAMRSGRASIVRPDHMSGALQQHVTSLGLQVLALAPVRSGHDIHGFLVASARDTSSVDRRELSLLEMLAQMAGFALVNAEHMQSQREHSDRMENLEKVKSHFLNLVSHELRSPLTVALGYVSMLEEEALGPLTPRSRSVLPIVMAKLNEMETLVEQMLEASRLEESALVLNRERIDMRDICRESIATFRPLLDGRHQLELVEPQGSVMVLADPNRVGTVLANLLSNAIKYSPEGGPVRCEVSVDGRWCRVSVSDLGLGISESDLPRVFTRFGRILTLENQGISGTGLGLYLSRELARQQGGDIVVVSQLGAGSTFILSLPVA
jgi:signal transduction histidine kinase